MTEYELVKIREALEKPSLVEAIHAMELVLDELGYTKQELTPISTIVYEPVTV